MALPNQTTGFLDKKTLTITQVRQEHRRPTGGGQHRLAQRVGHPRRLVPGHVRRRPAEPHLWSAPPLRHLQRQPGAHPGALLRSLQARRAHPRPHLLAW